MSFDNLSRAEHFRDIRIARGGDGVVRTFQVPLKYAEDIQRSAVPQNKVKDFFNSPEIADPPHPGQFGLRQQQIEALRKAIIQGTGKVLD